MPAPVRYLLLFLLLSTTCSGQPYPEAAGTRSVKIPADWIEQVRRFKAGDETSPLLSRLDSLIAPDTLEGAKDAMYPAGLLDPRFVNLDDDPAEELIGLCGWSSDHPALTVFKQVDSTWFLVWFEPYYMFYADPELQIVRTPAPQKTFYVRCLYERGSGIYYDGWQFYRLINGKVYPALSLVNRAHIYGWGLYLNQNIASTFRWDSTADALNVTYNYHFFAGPVYERDASWDAHKELTFVKAGKNIHYRWDSTSRTYQPGFSRQPGGLDAAKIATFGAFGNDTLFVRAFDFELKQTLRNGTALQKKVLQKYLHMVKAEGQARTTENEMEEKTQIGDLKFYGPKEKKE